jgi:hypothetical protein
MDGAGLIPLAEMVGFPLQKKNFNERIRRPLLPATVRYRQFLREERTL